MIPYPTSVIGIIVYGILLDLADFDLQEQPKDNLMVAIYLAVD